MIKGHHINGSHDLNHGEAKRHLLQRRSVLLGLVRDLHGTWSSGALSFLEGELIGAGHGMRKAAPLALAEYRLVLELMVKCLKEGTEDDTFPRLQVCTAVKDNLMHCVTRYEGKCFLPSGYSQEEKKFVDIEIALIRYALVMLSSTHLKPRPA